MNLTNFHSNRIIGAIQYAANREGLTLTHDNTVFTLYIMVLLFALSLHCNFLLIRSHKMFTIPNTVYSEWLLVALLTSMRSYTAYCWLIQFILILLTEHALLFLMLIGSCIVASLSISPCLSAM